jgi:hypothetical protein
MRFCRDRCRDRFWSSKRHPAADPKPCEICGVEFTPVRNAGNRAKYCSAPCRRVGWESSRRRSWLKRHYSISLERFDEMMAAQGGRCAVCGTDDASPHQYLSVDHDHQTGEPRGLLCNRCNVGIGRLGDDPDLIRKALAYLEGS